MLYLCDISNHNQGFNVAQAASEGYSAVIAKSSQGTWYQDPCFDGFAQQAINAGVIPGAYHWLENGSGKLQAELLYGHVVKYGGPRGWLCVCDCEDDADWQTLSEFFERWKQLTDNHPLILYTGKWWWDSRGWNASGLTPYLWHSHYVSGSGTGSELYEDVPDSWWSPGYGGWNRATILQYADTATVAGMTPIDVDAFLGTKDDLLKIAGKDVDMEQTDTLIKGPSTWRTIGDHLADMQELRNLLLGQAVTAQYKPTEDSPISTMLAAAEAILSGTQVTLSDAQMASLVDQVTAKVVAQLGDNLNALVAAFATVGEDLAKLKGTAQ